jgi:hypothetical protein
VNAGCLRGRRTRRALVAVSTAIGVAAFATPVAAQATATPDAALAEALFRDAKQLVVDGRLDIACPKFEESMRISPAGGTALNLAACHESQGRIATAWAEFNEAIAMARRDARPDREKLARGHLEAIEARLPHLTLALGPGADVPDLDIKLDGVVVRRASLGTAVPVDPGEHRIVAAAPGKAWETVVRIRESERLGVTIGPLASAPASPESVATASTAQRTAAIVVGSAGLVAIGIGAGFGVSAFVQHGTYVKECPADHCITTQGVADHDSASRAATISTAAFAVGLAAGVAAVVLGVTAPKTAPARKGLSVLPALGSSSAGAVLTGTW